MTRYSCAVFTGVHALLLVQPSQAPNPNAKGLSVPDERPGLPGFFAYLTLVCLPSNCGLGCLKAQSLLSSIPPSKP